MINRRLKPYLHDKSLKIDEISLLLREIEEHGGQHILLYQLGRNEALGDLFSPGSLEERIEGLPDWPRVGEASFVNLPEKQTIVEVRRDKKGSKDSVIVKFVEKRVHKRRKGVEQDKGDYLVRYSQETYRAVNVVRISADGIAEVRIFSHREATSYGGEAIALLQRTAPLVPVTKWESFPLGKLRNNLLNPKKRNEMKKQFKLGLIGSLDLFGEERNASHCDRAAVYILPERANEREIAVVLHGDTNGQPNEVSVGARISRKEYEHILNSVIKYNE